MKRASLREICAAAGILPGSLYYHFKSKEDLFVSLHAEGFRQLNEAVDTAIARESDPWSRLEAACAARVTLAGRRGRGRWSAARACSIPRARRCSGASTAIAMLTRSASAQMIAALRLPPDVDQSLAAPQPAGRAELDAQLVPVRAQVAAGARASAGADDPAAQSGYPGRKSRPELGCGGMSRPTRSVRLGPREVAFERGAGGGILPSALPASPRRFPGEDHRAARVLGERRAQAGAVRAARPGDGWRRLTYGAGAGERALGAWGQYLLSKDLSAERPLAVLSGNDIEHALLHLGAGCMSAFRTRRSRQRIRSCRRTSASCAPSSSY